MRLKNFLDVEIIALNFAGVEIIERKDIIGEITHFKGQNSCIVLCFDCDNNIKVIFVVQCGKKL